MTACEVDGVTAVVHCYVFEAGIVMAEVNGAGAEGKVSMREVW